MSPATVTLILDGLLRASVFLAAVLGAALGLACLLRRRAAARHALLCTVLLLAALAPLWLSLAARAPAPVARMQARPDAAAAPLSHVLGALKPWAPTPQLTAHPGELTPWLLSLWLLGAAFAGLRIGHGLLRAHGLRRRARPALPGPIPLLLSDEISAAVVVGFLRPAIVMGPALFADVQARDQVLAHERAHARRRDPLLGLLERVVAALYWFHPLVHVCVRAIARAREESCDDAAVAAGDHTRYARTLLALASSAAPFPALMGIAHPRDGRTLERRIRRLLAPRPPALPRRLALALPVGLALLSMLVGAPLARALAPADLADLADLAPISASATGTEAKAERLLRQAGRDVEGAFVLRDIDSGETVVVNPALARARLAPASTYKMVIALLGLEAHVISPETVLPWDGRVHEVPGWNRPLDLAGAMRTSATWYFQAIERKLDRAAVGKALANLRYGNQAQATADYWLDGSLAISALEQVDFLTRLARGELPLSARVREVLDEVTRLDQHDGAILFGKTGTATGTAVGTGSLVWLVGHVERGPRRHAYALIQRTPSDDSSQLRNKRVALTRALLALHGAWPAEGSP
jgi:beta-lactamase class D/beta-lactamase regulating signal transducer with metallopeptidase domain